MIALFALFSWPVVVIALFRRLDMQAALIVSIVAGYLLLPVSTSIDLPVLPALDKALVPTLAATIMAMIVTQGQKIMDRLTAPNALTLPGFLPRSKTGLVLVLLLVGGAAMTGLTNRDSVAYGPTVLSGYGLYDLLSYLMNTAVSILTFLVARKYLGHPSAHPKILFVICIAGLLYSLPALYEVRMSPQLNKIVYGFFPHSWQQHIRQGGFRPLVFLGHGLWLGIFLTASVLAAIGYMRAAKSETRRLYFFAVAWLLMTLVLSKNLGALLITLSFLPIVLLMGTRIQLIAACAIAVMIISYPALRGAGLIPTETAVEWAAKIEEERARSLRFRFWNEDELLEKANERPLFGWGGFGRSRIVNLEGADTTIADGHWIITLGVGGWLRYIAEFGLLAFPILLLSMRQKAYEVGMATSVLCIMLAGNMIDLIPNSGLTVITWMIAGSLMGRLEYQKVSDPSVEPSVVPRGAARARATGNLSLPADTAPGLAGATAYTRQTKYFHRANRLKS